MLQSFRTAVVSCFIWMSSDFYMLVFETVFLCVMRERGVGLEVNQNKISSDSL